MRENIKLFRTKMTQAGFKLMGHEESPICPVFLKDAVLANQMEKKLMDEYNIFVFAVYFPVVQRNKARIRCSVSGGHSTE
jgi:7-keto-8-aminopelargonate synthetase-like enzyme